MRYSEITKTEVVEAVIPAVPVVRPVLHPAVITRLHPELKQVIQQLSSASKTEQNNLEVAKAADTAADGYLALVAQFGELPDGADAETLREFQQTAQAQLRTSNVVMKNLAACRRIQKLFPKFGVLVGEMRHGAEAIIKYCIDAR